MFLILIHWQYLVLPCGFILEAHKVSKKYSIIYADPPWDYGGQTQHNKVKSSGGADKHYPCMKLRQLKMMKVKEITEDDCLLFLWSTSPHLDQSIELMKAWGFDYKTIGFVWNKERVNPGFYTMSQVEVCLIGKKGKIPSPRGKRNIRQYLKQMRGKHSSKPNEVRKRIEEMFPSQSKVELFARSTSGGWDSWGNEASNVDLDLL